MARTPTGSVPSLPVRPRATGLRRPRARTQIALLAMVAAAALGACTGSAPSSGMSESPVSSEPVSAGGIGYGPDPAQLLDVYQPTGGGRSGTIVYLHAGGWVSGSRTKVSELVASELARGWAVVSVDYRLAPDVHADEMLGDVDRSIRWVRAHGAGYGLPIDTIVVAGGSAGGHLSAMAGVAAGAHAAPDLPSDLASASPMPDGIIDMVGPTDLTTFWRAGGWAPGTTAQLLGCSPGPADPGAEPCAPGVAEDTSPLEWARRASSEGERLPPAFLAYGPDDALVPPSTQGDPLHDAWARQAPPGSVVYERPAGAGHNLEPQVDRARLDAWLDAVAARSF